MKLRHIKAMLVSMLSKSNMIAEYYYKPKSDRSDIYEIVNPIFCSTVIEQCDESDIERLLHYIKETINDIDNGYCSDEQQKFATPYIVLDESPNIREGHHVAYCIKSSDIDSYYSYDNGTRYFNWYRIAFFRDELFSYCASYKDSLPSTINIIKCNTGATNSVSCSIDTLNINSNNTQSDESVSYDTTILNSIDDEEYANDIRAISQFFLTFKETYKNKLISEDEFMREMKKTENSVSTPGAKQAWKWVPNDFKRKKGRPRKKQTAPKDTSAGNE